MGRFDAEQASGEFRRQPNRFTDRIAADSDSAAGEGPDAHRRWPVEAGRYRLVISRHCPWAHRSVIVRELLGLDEAISLAVVDPIRDDAGWRFTLDPGGRDPVLGISLLSEAYLRTDPEYRGRVTVPCIIDERSGLVVTNDFQQISIDLSEQWREFHRAGMPDLRPAGLRAEMDELIEFTYCEINDGVYRCGLATTQTAYDAAYDRLWAALDLLADRLSDRRFLMGEALTEVDVRLFTTLVRFDAVYHGHFRCNRNKLTEMPTLWRYARELYSLPGFGTTVDFEQIKLPYYASNKRLNPTGIVPKGPEPKLWTCGQRSRR